jgi:2-methylcitrate dehydratase PrpD
VDARSLSEPRRTASSSTTRTTPDRFTSASSCFSAALPVAESRGLHDPAAFFSAAAAGYEMAARLAMAVQPKYHYARGFHPTSTCGVFGAAVTVSKLLGLSEEQMLDAVGIAGSMAAGSLEFLADGAWTKRLHAGLAAQNGIPRRRISSARIPRPVDHPRRSQRIHSTATPTLRDRSCSPQDLGKSFAILETSIKPHACCRYKQGPIDALLQIRAKHHVDYRDVRRIEVTILEAGAGLIAEPAERKFDPQSVVDAQFSMPFGAALALVHGRAGLKRIL